MKKNKLSGLCTVVALLLPITFAQATPLLSFSPLTPTTIPVASNGNAVVQYDVTNNSSRSHTLMMNPIKGVSQITTAGNCPNPFTLASKKTCTLTLSIYGNQVQSPVAGGPIVCQQGPDGKPSPLQCYQPSAINSLKITVKGLQTPLVYAGLQNGLVYFSSNDGATWTPTNAPAGGNAINSVIATSTTLYAAAANGSVYSSFNNGTSWSNIVTPAPGFAVNGLSISPNNKLYIASATGTLFICALNGTSCSTTTAPAPGVALNSVFATATALYTASANGSVYYSNNNGLSWTAINGQPDGSPVKSIYVAANTLYTGTANEYVYNSTSLTGGGNWSTYAQTVYSLFANADASSILAGTQGGYVFSLSSGNQLGFITYSPVNSVFLLG